MLSSHGYVLIRVGPDHPLAMGHGYAYLHELIWASSGRPMPKDGEVLHHRDEDKGHNALDNLEKLTDVEHGRRHIAQRDRDALGRLKPRTA